MILESPAFRRGEYVNFELAWKALKEVLELHKISDVYIGSPRNILKAAYKTGFIDNENVWLLRAC